MKCLRVRDRGRLQHYRDAMSALALQSQIPRRLYEKRKEVMWTF